MRQKTNPVLNVALFLILLGHPDNGLENGLACVGGNRPGASAFLIGRLDDTIVPYHYNIAGAWRKVLGPAGAVQDNNRRAERCGRMLRKAVEAEQRPCLFEKHFQFVKRWEQYPTRRRKPGHNSACHRRIGFSGNDICLERLLRHQAVDHLRKPFGWPLLFGI
jgi:hypothetical protein